MLDDAGSSDFVCNNARADAPAAGRLFPDGGIHYRGGARQDNRFTGVIV
jgi:hypothetical protein